MMYERDQEMIDMFVDEAGENVEKVEELLLDWGKVEEDTETIGALFRAIHTIKGNAGFFEFLADMERLAHAWETALEDAKKQRIPLNKRPIDLYLKLSDIIKHAIKDLAAGNWGAIEGADDLIEEIKASHIEMLKTEDSTDSEPTSEEDDKKTSKKTPAKKSSEKKSKKKEEPKPEAKKAPEKAQEAQTSVFNSASADIRVNLTKLDSLINLIGEMVIAQNMLINHYDQESGDDNSVFAKSAQQMSKITRELQELAVSIRMVPVAPTFKKMTRIAHDVTSKLKKSVNVVLEGTETEIDKTVIETITDPMVHIIRNAVDHGIEMPKDRIEAGKPETGTVKLSACHEEGEVWIIIEDDGKGLDKDMLLSKAQEKGIVGEDTSSMSDNEIYSLIFAPGFSTAAQVTDVSGRGVGMDVVKRNLELIQGRIDVSSEVGKGTKITLRIPLTLAIIDGMMIRVGETIAILPMLTIKEAFTPNMAQITVTPSGAEIVKLREEFHPILRLNSLIKDRAASNELEEGTLIILEHQNFLFAIFVDEIVGQQQTVVKALPSYVGDVPGVSGCTILGDGSVCLILDVSSLEHRASKIKN